MASIANTNFFSDLILPIGIDAVCSRGERYFATGRCMVEEVGEWYQRQAVVPDKRYSFFNSRVSVEECARADKQPVIKIRLLVQLILSRKCS